MAEGQGLDLEIPENNDNGVVEAMKELNSKLKTHLMKNYLKVAGEFLYVATNATAKDADQQIKVQSCLFDAVKLCDAWNLMLTSFKVGASDILEKLHIAYLKLLDGFPDFALADVESVTKHVSSMKAACKKAEGSFTTVIKELKGTIRFLEEEKKKNCSIRENYQDEYGKKACELEKRIMEKMLSEDLAVVAKDVNLKILESELAGPRDNYHGVFKKIENGRLAEVALRLALPKLKDALEFLVEVELLVDKWFNECKEVVEKNMKANVKQAGKLPEAKQKEFWKPLVFVKTAYNFLCRWKALQQICLSTSSHMRRVRGDIDWYYTENLYPSEAVEKAWALREKNEELKEKVEPRKQNNVVPDHDRIEGIRTLQKLLEMAMQMGGGTQPGDPINSGGYRQQLEIIGSYLWYLGHMARDQNIHMIKQGLNNVCSDLLVGAENFRQYSATGFASWFTICKYALDDVPRRAEGSFSGDDQLEKIVRNLSGDIRSLNESDLGSAKGQFDKIVTDGWKQLEKDIKTEECNAVVEEYASTGGIWSDIGSFVKRQKAKMLSDQKKSDAVAESIKKYQLAVDIIQGIEKQLPVDDITGVYSKVSGNLKMLSSNMRNELRKVEGEHGKPPVQERSREWQDGVICNLLGFIELFSTNSGHVKIVQDLFEYGMINKQTNVGISWTELKQMVRADTSLYRKASEIDAKVNSRVADQRMVERHNEQERLRKEREKQERIKREKAEEERKERIKKEKAEEERRERIKREKEEEEKKKMPLAQQDRNKRGLEEKTQKEYTRYTVNHGESDSYATRQTGGAIPRETRAPNSTKQQETSGTRERRSKPERTGSQEDEKGAKGTGRSLTSQGESGVEKRTAHTEKSTPTEMARKEDDEGIKSDEKSPGGRENEQPQGGTGETKGTIWYRGLKEDQGNVKLPKKEPAAHNENDPEKHKTLRSERKEGGTEEDNIPPTETGEKKDGASRDSLDRQNSTPYSGGCTYTRENVRGSEGKGGEKKDGASKDNLNRQNSSSDSGGCTHPLEDVHGSEGKDEDDNDAEYEQETGTAVPELKKRKSARY